MNNTIANVPRELLADLLGNDHDKRIMAERHLLAMLANAPSPAGVDGLKRYEVFPYLDDDVAELDICEADDGSFVKYDAAQAIIDGLRAERDQQAQRIGELEGLLRNAFPRIDITKPVPLDEKAHCCEYTIYVERERLHKLIDAALSAGNEPKQCT